MLKMQMRKTQGNLEWNGMPVQFRGPGQRQTLGSIGTRFAPTAKHL